MKVYITDTRRDTRILVIDGRHIILPSKKEVLRDISTSAFRSLSTLPFIKLRVYEEPKQVEQPKIDVQPEPKTESTPVEEPKQEEPVVAKNETTESQSTSVIVDQEEQSIEEHKVESTEESTPVVEESTVEEHQTETQSETVDFSKLTKKELKELAESKGCDTTGMVKADLVQWLTENA
jgi:hypothetical protein